MTETMKENPENVQKFANAMQKACLWGHANPDEAAEVGAKRFGTADPKIIGDASKRIIQQGAYPAGLVVRKESYDNKFNAHPVKTNHPVAKKPFRELTELSVPKKAT